MSRKVRVLNIDEARRFASANGLLPFVSGDKYGFSQHIRLDMKQLNWTELEEILCKEKLSVYEIGGFIKILKSTEIEETIEKE